MRRDKNAPALLELIAKGRAPVTSRPVVGSAQAPATMAGPTAASLRPIAPAPSPAPAAPAPRVPEPQPAPVMMPEETAVSSWFSPGRAIRVPTGYVVPVGLLIVVLVVGAYATGYRSRKSEELTLKSDSAAQEMAALVDPLNQPVGSAAVPAPSKPVQKPAAAVPKANMPKGGSTQPKPAENRANPPVSGKAAGVVMVKGAADDPRQSGLNYLIAATLPLDEAEKAAAFLVSRGLEIAVVPADNRSLRWVVVLQGVAAKDLSGPSAKTLEQRLQTLGREYKQVLKGPTVFNDPWWKKHTK